jgi:hypothetical protein
MPAAPRARKTAAAKKVDETVVNQENPGTSTEDRSPENDEAAPAVAKAAPAHEVDETVINQESLGSGEVVDRSPEPQLVENSTGATYDVSKSSPELVDPNADETETRRNRIRQSEGVMNAKDLVEDDDEEKRDYVELEFVESGLTAQGRVWKKGEVLKFEDGETSRKVEADTNGNVWYDLSASEQKERYGKVFFEKR